MNQETIKESLVKHLEIVDRTLLWALAIAVVVGWAGIRGGVPIEILGIRTTRSDAHFVASLAFVFANLAILVALLRMGDLLKRLHDAEFTNGIEKVLTHSSLFNPFAYFGPGLLSRSYSSSGFGLLIVCWWICYTSVSGLRDFSTSPNLVEGLLLGVGSLSLLAIHHFHASLQGRLHNIDATYAQLLIRMNKMRSRVVAVSAVTGGVIFFVVRHYAGK